MVTRLRQPLDLQSSSGPTYDDPTLKIHLTNPHKDIEIQGPTRVRELLQHLNLTPEAYLVIRGDELVTEDEVLHDSDSIEIRGVISGG